MKKIYMIGGTMGVGKTTVCQMLKQKLKNSVFLDGDWCWDMNPFKVTQETKSMVNSNICYMLNNFIKCSSIENIIFCWVMHQQNIIDNIISNLNIKNCKVILISLICDEKNLRKRLEKDIENGIRSFDIIEKSIRYIHLYENLNTIKVNVSQKSIEEIAEEIMNN